MTFQISSAIQRGLGFLLSASIILPLSASPALAVGECMPRYLSKNIKDAVLAVKAAKYCPNVPYTIAEASARVDQLRCNPEASSFIDEMLHGHEHEYRTIMTQDAGQLVCAQAAAIALN